MIDPQQHAIDQALAEHSANVIEDRGRAVRARREAERPRLAVRLRRWLRRWP